MKNGISKGYIWQEVEKISNVSCEETEEELKYSMTEENQYHVIGRRFNWSKLYGKLESGDYEFTLEHTPLVVKLYRDPVRNTTVRILFSIDENGNNSHYKAIFKDY